MKLVFNFPYKFVDNEVGFLLGKPVNYVSKSDDEEIKNLFDDYNALNSALVNEIADHRNAYLAIENAKLEEEDLGKMKQMGIIQVPSGGKVSWLNKDINDSFVKKELDNIERKIYDLMDEVNLNENWAFNTQILKIEYQCEKLLWKR